MRAKKFDTIAVHGMYDMREALANQGSILEPAFLSPAQHFENSNHMEVALAYQMPSWTYSRIANPTLHYLEETLALLEGYGYAGEVSACVTGSGMSAIFMATNPFLVVTPACSRSYGHGCAIRSMSMNGPARWTPTRASSLAKCPRTLVWACSTWPRWPTWPMRTACR